jgi:hypothetical protein
MGGEVCKMSKCGAAKLFYRRSENATMKALTNFAKSHERTGVMLVLGSGEAWTQ